MAKARKLKILAKYMKIEIFFNKITFAIDRIDFYNIPKTLFVFRGGI